MNATRPNPIPVHTRPASGPSSALAFARARREDADRVLERARHDAFIAHLSELHAQLADALGAYIDHVRAAREDA